MLCLVSVQARKSAALVDWACYYGDNSPVVVSGPRSSRFLVGPLFDNTVWLWPMSLGILPSTCRRRAYAATRPHGRKAPRAGGPNGCFGKGTAPTLPFRHVVDDFRDCLDLRNFGEKNVKKSKAEERYFEGTFRMDKRSIRNAP